MNFIELKDYNGNGVFHLNADLITCLVEDHETLPGMPTICVHIRVVGDEDEPYRTSTSLAEIFEQIEENEAREIRAKKEAKHAFSA